MQHHTHTHSAAAGLCPTCFGFPVVAVAASARRGDSRRLNLVRCGTCKGTGRATATPSARVAIPAGVAA
ncbi:hypothetical protein KBZ94_38925 [Streptomyces sp. RM72]|uniref:hypothetical protein n=1 Tax=Streptomyces sp. RM72 TaxID=1115510 RepID=UPI001B3942D8|nr:hypothetical protein [Streptomyces sp. RM72]MBQ0890827.1 hypothetical protein [Streptomyces sp. RM72]